DSRLEGTRLICDTLNRLQKPPKILVCASAIGYYGNRGDEVLDERFAAGEGFLADLCKEWEAITESVRPRGIRVVNVRFGIILSAGGGALAKMLTPFKLGVGGVIGSGRQYMSWIGLDDVIGAIHHAITCDALNGPVNVVAPNSVTNHDFTKTLGRVLRRPTVLPMPAFAARLALGEMADELLLASIPVLPRRLEETGYKFRDAQLEPTLRHALGR
ncbi:MAG TPA: TIGR01777 family oxidoreductase, partial [Planctomycetaceae bacterium]|nr:TIGR01777 family oxidoreductase [Planctomycetaceae bacterium]